MVTAMKPIKLRVLLTATFENHIKVFRYSFFEKVALQIHSWQVDANIFKVVRYSLLRDFYQVSLFFVAL